MTTNKDLWHKAKKAFADRVGRMEEPLSEKDIEGVMMISRLFQAIECIPSNDSNKILDYIIKKCEYDTRTNQ